MSSFGKRQLSKYTVLALVLYTIEEVQVSAQVCIVPLDGDFEGRRGGWPRCCRDAAERGDA